MVATLAVVTDDGPIACIFLSTRTQDHDDEYEAWSVRLDEMVRATPGYLSHESVRDPLSRRGITVAYFDSEASMEHWRTIPEHLEAQNLGRRSFYEEYTVQLVRVVDERSWPSRP
jgi:heme-degrading monooxygenase HmoA